MVFKIKKNKTEKTLEGQKPDLDQTDNPKEDDLIKAKICVGMYLKEGIITLERTKKHKNLDNPYKEKRHPYSPKQKTQTKRNRK